MLNELNIRGNDDGKYKKNTFYIHYKKHTHTHTQNELVD
jgi:hypothetical protein